MLVYYNKYNLYHLSGTNTLFNHVNDPRLVRKTLKVM